MPDVVGASVVAIEASDEPGASKQVEQRSDRLCGGWGSHRQSCDSPKASPRRRPLDRRLRIGRPASAAFRHSTGAHTRGFASCHRSTSARSQAGILRHLGRPREVIELNAAVGEIAQGDQGPKVICISVPVLVSVNVASPFATL